MAKTKKSSVNPKISLHAIKRSRKRHGIGKKAIARMARMAFKNGLRWHQLNCPLRLYLRKKHDPSDETHEVILYGVNVYVFKTETLITTFPVPNELKDLAIRAQKDLARTGPKH